MKYDYENDSKAFNSATIDFFYDDSQITMAVERQDIDNCMAIMKDILYKHFGIKEK